MKKAYSVNTLFEMFQAVLKAIIIAYQDDKTKIPDICEKASTSIDRIKKRLLLRRSL